MNVLTAHKHFITLINGKQSLKEQHGTHETKQISVVNTEQILHSSTHHNMQVTHFLLIHCFGSKQLLISNKGHQLQYDKSLNNIALGYEVHT